ncbi:hypothetical protein OG746_39050 [Streptomyces sp. NBC_01016]|uniref:hypothetical protein n=1 Tax=Streptomyces sp. NBC_01016 TaxID=2903720 RepID=UPI00224EDB21|nr:hypothetical protein [Streptomyces sp. NBC_01016]MCX4834702.1 hypothetical protein [Streptomyces sp. NBC_01016]
MVSCGGSGRRPLGCVDRVYTDLAVFDITPQSVRVAQTFGVNLDEFAARMDVPLIAAEG